MKLLKKLEEYSTDYSTGHFRETLYVSEEGKYFLYSYNGAAIRWSDNGPRETFRPMDEEDVSQWLDRTGKTLPVPSPSGAGEQDQIRIYLESPFGIDQNGELGFFNHTTSRD